MKKFIIASLLFSFFLQTSLHSAAYEKIPTSSFFSRIAHMYHTITRTVLGNSFSMLKNIKWTKTTIAKAGIIATVAAITAYGVSRLAKYFFKKEHCITPSVPITTPIVQPVIPPNTTVPVNTVPTVTPVVVPTQQVPVQAAATATQENSLAVVSYFNDPAHHVIEPPIVVENPIDHARVTVQQLRVFNQFEEDQYGQSAGGGDNSCGYHAGPKNAVALAGLIQGRDTSALLTNGQLARTLFNLDSSNRGILRSMVIRNRQKAALYDFYRQQVQTRIPERLLFLEDSSVITAKYNGLIKVCLNNFITDVFAGRARVIEVSEHTIIEALSRIPITVTQTELDALGGWTERAFIDFMHAPETITHYLVPTRPFRVSQDDLIAAMTAYNAKNGRSMQDGEMLESEEIKTLISEFCKNNTEAAAALNPERVAVHAFESSTPEELGVLDELPALKEQIRHQQLPQKKIHLFVLGNTNQFKRNKGHWVTMALEIARNGRRYTITDSADNHIRLFGGVCHNLIRYLEGDHVADILQPSPAFKQRLITQLKDAMQQCRENPGNSAFIARLQSTHQEFDNFVSDQNRYDIFGGFEEFGKQFGQLIAH